MNSVSLSPDPSPPLLAETAASPTQHRDVPAVTSDEAAASPAITRKMPTNGKHVVLIGHLRDGQIWPIMTLEQRHDVMVVKSGKAKAADAMAVIPATEAALLQAIRENDEERRRLAQLIREQVLLVSGQAPQPTPGQDDL